MHESNQDIQALPEDKASRILLAIQDSDTVLLRNIFPGNIAQTYQLDPEQIIDEACDTLSFTDEQYGTRDSHPRPTQSSAHQRTRNRIATRKVSARTLHTLLRLAPSRLAGLRRRKTDRTTIFPPRPIRPYQRACPIFQTKHNRPTKHSPFAPRQNLLYAQPDRATHEQPTRARSAKHRLCSHNRAQR
jgi:hypothetical protein